LARFPFDVDDTRGPRVLLADRVRSVMIGTISAAAKMQTEQQVAEVLGISLATLKRRLKAEHTSFRRIREALLRTIAIDTLKSGVSSVDVLANRLGFGDAASFRHAFKRWTGHSPSHYQRTASVTRSKPE
jgi:AraC-like DNA-binding protein